MRAGRWLTWALVAFMAANIGMSTLALARYDQRCRGVEAEASWQIYMDDHYDDAKNPQDLPPTRSAHEERREDEEKD